MEIECRHCGKRNRVGAIGTKAIRCGNQQCREALATPFILTRLRAVRAELANLDRKCSRSMSPRQIKEMERSLERQLRTLTALKDYPGYSNTLIACFNLRLEIEGHASDLRRKLDGTYYQVAKKMLSEMIKIIRNVGPLALP